jgi:hypothetical protein
MNNGTWDEVRIRGFLSVSLRTTYSEVNSVPPHDIVLVDQALGPRLGQVENSANVRLLEDVAQSPLVFNGEVDDRDLGTLNGRLNGILDVRIGSEQLVAQWLQVAHDLGQFAGGWFAAEEQAFAGLWHAEVHGALHGGPVGLDLVLTEAGHFSSRRHLDAKIRVRAGKTSPGELGNFDRLC